MNHDYKGAFHTFPLTAVHGWEVKCCRGLLEYVIGFNKRTSKALTWEGQTP